MRLKNLVKNIAGRVRLIYAGSGSSCRCYICGRTLRSFLPFRNGWQGFSSFYRELLPIGSDVENYQCPFCRCHDRERHLFMYFDRLDLWKKIENARILHFAPERLFSARIMEERPQTYIKADLSPSKPDYQKIDVTQIPFDDNSFDIIICNHVIEHVQDDRGALAELFRVLNPGGFAILQTPYSGLLEYSFSDPAINTDELRNRYYGQEDHIRVYGQDLFQRIVEAGFQLHLKSHADVLPDKDATYFGVNQKEDLIFATKGISDVR